MLVSPKFSIFDHFKGKIFERNLVIPRFALWIHPYVGRFICLFFQIFYFWIFSEFIIFKKDLIICTLNIYLCREIHNMLISPKFCILNRFKIENTWQESGNPSFRTLNISVCRGIHNVPISPKCCILNPFKIENSWKKSVICHLYFEYLPMLRGS